MAVNEIKCIFFSEFHPTTGPKITFQFPEDYISKEKFDYVHRFIITKPELKDRLITVNALGHKVVGCPVCIDNRKYDRNALIFNLCFVFDQSAETTSIEPVVKKLASYCTQFELESGFLFNEKSKGELPHLLEEILISLNSRGQCSVQVGSFGTIHLKVPPKIKDPPAIMDYDVPIIVNDKYMMNKSNLDLTTLQILPYMDNFKHVARIATEADVEINLTKSCLQNLLHYNVIKIVSIFQYSNAYITCPEISRLVEDVQLQDECIRYVARKGLSAEPKFRDLFMLYCSLAPGTTVRDLCNRYNPHNLKIDEKKLIQFGLMKGLIRRWHKYPIKLTSESDSHRQRNLHNWFNGLHSYDEICCKTGHSYQEIENKVENDPSIVMCWK